LLSLCREIAGARDILQKFENLKNNTSGISLKQPHISVSPPRNMHMRLFQARVEFQLMILHFYDGDQRN
jgi:hypothetical protein